VPRVPMTANGAALPRPLVRDAGRVVTGEARFEPGPQSIHGTVREDGAFGATIGFQHLVGKFIDNTFEGTFNSLNCEWKMILKRTN
jgi:hypothetical protein